MKIKIQDKNGVKLLTKDKYVTEDIEVGVDESLLGGGVEIPSVTNLTCDSDGNVSWAAPNFDNLADYNPTISYVVSVNGSEVTTKTSTSINVKNYFIDGINTISVKVKAILTNYDNGVNTSIEYSTPVLGIVELNTTLQNKVYKGAVAAINTDIYYFGGIDDNVNRYNVIQKFDTTNETIEVLDVTLEDKADTIQAISVGTNIYIFGGYGSYYSPYIQKFDTISQTITSLTTTLNKGASQLAAAIVGTNIYIFGGKTGADDDTNAIQKFDTINETIEVLNTKLNGGYWVGCTASTVGTNIYIFGGGGAKTSYSKTNLIQKFDTISQTITSLTTRLKYSTSNIGSASIGDNIYLFGGVDDDKISYNVIQKFDTTNETIEVLDVVLPKALSFIPVCNVNDCLYLLGGHSESVKYYNILKFTT